jgi:hypothetical protein
MPKFAWERGGLFGRDKLRRSCSTLSRKFAWEQGGVLMRPRCSKQARRILMLPGQDERSCFLSPNTG